MRLVSQGTVLLRSNWKYLLVLVLGSLAVATFYLQNSSARFDADTRAAESKWAERIATKGGRDAYKEFVAENSSVQVGLQHRFAHAFGAALYATEGATALGTCDMQFQFGCLHEFFKHIIAEYGVDQIGNIGTTCSETLGQEHPCEHAIGHGLVANLGYTNEGLKQSLELCDEFFPDDPINGCIGGVFMEYNLYTSFTIDFSPRPVINDDWYVPCFDLPEKYLRTCTIWSVQWWHQYFEVGTTTKLARPDVHARLGELCRNFPDTTFLDDCFKSIGQKVAFDSRFKSDKAIAYCDLAAQGNSKHELLCKSYAAYIFTYSDAAYHHDAEDICKSLPREYHEHCKKYASKEHYYLHDLPLPPELLHGDEPLS